MNDKLKERTGPLSDVTIIDCTMALAGPFGTAMLADLGANVIKVEPPHGDGSRPVSPLPPDYANVSEGERRRVVVRVPADRGCGVGCRGDT